MMLNSTHGMQEGILVESMPTALKLQRKPKETLGNLLEMIKVKSDTGSFSLNIDISGCCSLLDADITTIRIGKSSMYIVATGRE